MRDDRVEKLADILTEYSIPLAAGRTAVVEGTSLGEPLMMAIYERLLKRGVHVLLRPTLPQAQRSFYEHARGAQLEYIWETERWVMENVDARFVVLAESNTKLLAKVDPAKQATVARARTPLTETMMRRSAAKELLWNVTLFPTEAYAIDAGMSLHDYEEFYYGACLIDRPDPISEWRSLAARHEKLTSWMKGRNLVHIEGEGTDLYLEIGGRTFEPANGNYNFPDGEFFTGPIEDRTRGVVTFSYPAIWQGKSVEGIQLVFEEGRVVHATARTNEAFLREMLDADDGARVLGELGIGTNYGITDFSGSVLLDEKIGGTIHLALGAAYPETGGLNRSAIHWDMVCDLRRGGRITVDGDVLMEDGKLLV
ncbi:MAG: aminopeptidase [Candidatus Dormibacteraceae bacterium]